MYDFNLQILTFFCFFIFIPEIKLLHYTLLIIYNRTVSHSHLTSFTKLWNFNCNMFFFTLLVLSWLFLHHIVLNSIVKFDSRSVFCSQMQISRSPNVKTHKCWLEPAETSCFKIKALVFESIEPLIQLLLVRSCMTSWVSFSRVISVGISFIVKAQLPPLSSSSSLQYYVRLWMQNCLISQDWNQNTTRTLSINNCTVQNRNNSIYVVSN